VATESPQEADIAGEAATPAAQEPTKRLLLRFSTANLPHPEKVRSTAVSRRVQEGEGGGGLASPQGLHEPHIAQPTSIFQ